MSPGPEDDPGLPRPRVPVPPPARTSQGHRAGLVTRLAAGTLDAVVAGALLGVVYFGFAFAVFLVDPRGFSFPQLGLVFSLGSALAVATLYLTVAQVLTGRTYGALVMGLRVVRRGGRPLRLPLAAARAVLVVLVPIGVLWVPIGRENRSLQDILLGTEVVYDWRAREPVARR